MNRLLAIALASTALASPALAQTATAVGTGVGVSRSDSAAGAVAIGGGAAQGGNSALTINSAPIPTSTSTTITNQGTSTVKNVPSVFAPGLAAAGLETCLGSVSGGGAFVGTGFSFGTTIPDPGCAARLDARTLWSMGLKKAAVARLCLNGDIARAMPEVCSAYLPVATGYGYAAPVAAPAYYLPEGQPYSGGPIMLVEGKTGRERLCSNYDEPKQRCRAWEGAKAHVVIRHTKPKAKVVAVAPATPPVQPQAAQSEGK